MTEEKHTPGPWSFQPSESGDVIWIGNEGENAACVPGYADHPGNIADARLIAAAPDMLDALRKIAAIEDLYEGTDWQEIEEARLIARAAIAKATGG
jgi:hypothetical protein